MSYPARGPAFYAGIDGKASAAGRRWDDVGYTDDVGEAHGVSYPARGPAFYAGIDGKASAAGRRWDEVGYTDHFEEAQ